MDQDAPAPAPAAAAADDDLSPGPSRRTFVASTVATGIALALDGGCANDQPAADAARPARAESPPAAAAAPAPPAPDVTLNINGRPYRLAALDPRVTLLDALRERLNFTGTKKGCDHGQCGACTVLVDGRRVLSCLTLAATVGNAPITTIEGLARGDDLHPVQAAFIQYDAFQCGYCTPGQICSAVGLINEGRAKSDDDIREQMSGNICRCAAYPNIVAAVREAMTAAKT